MHQVKFFSLLALHADKISKACIGFVVETTRHGTLHVPIGRLAIDYGSARGRLGRRSIRSNVRNSPPKFSR